MIGDNVLVMSVPEDLTERNVFNGLSLEAYAREIYRKLADEFDYLIFLSNLSSIEDFNGRVYYGELWSKVGDGMVRRRRGFRFRRPQCRR